MAIIGSYVMKTTLIGVMNGVKTTNKFLHFPVTGTRATPQAYATYWLNTLLPLIEDFTSEGMVYQRIIADEVGPGGALQYQATMSEVGNVLGDALGPNIVFSFRKAADNSAIEGSSLTPFQLGGFRLTGVPEASQDKGMLNQAAIDACNTFASAVRNFTVGAAEYTMYMERPDPLPNMPPASAAPVAAVVVSSVLGTQNTRKY